jgi:hypothetical protein
MIKTRLSPKLIETFTDTQKNMIFELQQRSIANMTLNKESDIDYFISQLGSKQETNFIYEFQQINSVIESLNC